MLSLDSENDAWLQEHMQNGDLPNLAALAASGVTLPVATGPLAGVPYPTMYSGLRPADLGFYFPLQWHAEQQRLVSWLDLPMPETIFQRVDRSAKRIVVLDPPESHPVRLQHGFAASGVQFRSRVLLHTWTSDQPRWANMMNRLGASHRADEVFGEPSVAELRRLRTALLTAPARLAKAALKILKQEPPDCLWLTFCGLHVAAHQFYRLPLVQDPEERRLLEGTRLDIAKGYDRLIGSLVEALPPGSRIFAGYAKGMANLSYWADLLPAMLRRILGQRNANQPVNLLRRFIPRNFRRWAAQSISDNRALQMMVRLSSPTADWSRTRAFCLPTDFPGLIRFNVQGRERFGIVKEREIRELREEIAEGLSTFDSIAGTPCVQTLKTPAELYGTGRFIDRFPDLIVTWKHETTAPTKAVRSAKFGTIQGTADVVGRSGNHAPGAFGILAGVPANQVDRGGAIEIEDFVPTLLAGLGLPSGNLPGRPLWKN